MEKGKYIMLLGGLLAVGFINLRPEKQMKLKPLEFGTLASTIYVKTCSTCDHRYKTENSYSLICPQCTKKSQAELGRLIKVTHRLRRTRRHT